MNDYNNQSGYALDWDSEIQYTESNFIVLPEGTYPYTVTGFDRQNYDGSAKIPPCKAAVVHLKVDGGPLGVANVDERLFLHSNMMWKLSEFFTSIGMLQKDGSVRMNWNAVPGAVGKLELYVNKWEKDGQKKENNRVKAFLPPEQGAPAYRQPAPPPPPSQPVPQWGTGQTAMGKFQKQGRTADYQQEKF